MFFDGSPMHPFPTTVSVVRVDRKDGIGSEAPSPGIFLLGQFVALFEFVIEHGGSFASRAVAGKPSTTAGSPYLLPRDH